MNQIFSFPRFIKYATFKVKMQGKALMLTVAGTSLAIFLIALFIIFDGRNYINGINTFFITAMFIGATLFISSSFHDFRKKETSLHYLMIPASGFEKYIYEFFSRIVFFLVVYPVLFYVIIYLSNSFAGIIKPEKTIYHFNFNFLFVQHDIKIYEIVLWTYILGSSITFAGTTAIKKFPLIKTVLFVGTLFLVTIGYLYILFEKLDLHEGLDYIGNRIIHTQEQAITCLYGFFTITVLSALVYSYFKLKEKEV